MPLLELPLEVFEHITHFLVGSLEVTKVVQYRKVCSKSLRLSTVGIQDADRHRNL